MKHYMVITDEGIEKNMKSKRKMSFTEDIRNAPETETVCYCSDVTKAEILNAMDNGARILADIKEVTGACTQGGCKELSPRGR